MLHQPSVGHARVEIPASRLSTAALDGLIEEFVTRDGTDYGEQEHTLEAAMGLLHFPGTPAIYVCHDWCWEHDIPPKISRIRQFVAVDHTVRDCTHCGCDDLQVIELERDPIVLAVRCSECGASGPRSLSSDSAHAVFAWNHRVGRLSVV